MHDSRDFACQSARLSACVGKKLGTFPLPEIFQTVHGKCTELYNVWNKFRTT
jgi:hypothetical protein